MSSVDQLLFLEHIKGAKFQTGIDKGMWGLSQEDPTSSWPNVIIWIKGTTGSDSSYKIYLRFNLDHYPQAAPTGCPWNIEDNIPLVAKLWPTGNINIQSVFNPNWNSSALYAPCDRMAIPGHEAWASQHPEYWWNPTHQITNYLQFVYRLLNQHG